MSLSLSLRQSAHLTMTPLLQRSIQLLQLSNLEFQQQVEEVISDNPFLESADLPAEPPAGAIGAPYDMGALDEHHANGDLHTAASGSTDPMEASDLSAESEGLSLSGDVDEPVSQELSAMDAGDDSVAWADLGERPSSNARGDEDGLEPWTQVSRQASLREHLRAQAGLLRLSARDRLVVESVIDAIDDAGYLRTPLEDVAQCCPLDPVPEEDEMRIALRHVQSMDPSGVGARDVAECLLLQLQCRLDQAPADRGPGKAIFTLAQSLVRHHLNVLAQHDFAALQRALACSAQDLQHAVQLLRSLSPRPGSAFDADTTQYVVADVIVRRRAGQWIALINPEVVPRVRIHHRHVELMRGTREPDGRIAECMKEARWLVRNVQQRFQTIQQVAQAIVDHQSRYFDYGEMAMRPLTLAEIAARTGMHESTVSRVTSRKYMATPRGLLEFKRFFSSHVSTAAGTPCSATAVRAVIQELVQAEDPQVPLSDIRLTRMLEQRGIRVARRTVSKYRDAMRIPPVEMRRMTAPGQFTL